MVVFIIAEQGARISRCTLASLAVGPCTGLSDPEMRRNNRALADGYLSAQFQL